MHDAVQAYLEGGIPADKIILGMPAYGRSFQATSGFGEPYSGVGLANLGPGNWEDGIWEYKVLPKQSGETFYDDVAQASYSYDATTRELISYNSPQAVQAKVAYVKHKELGDTMF
ncbi:Chitinase 4 [Fusarium falciforme]